jgi:hypothetical protein
MGFGLVNFGLWKEAENITERASLAMVVAAMEPTPHVTDAWTKQDRRRVQRRSLAVFSFPWTDYRPFVGFNGLTDPLVVVE